MKTKARTATSERMATISPGMLGLALALAIGFLIGIERGWRMREAEKGSRVAGVRTFTILGLLGGIIGLNAAGPLQFLMPWLALGAFAALLLGYAGEMRRNRNVSATSTLAGMATLALGAAATTGNMTLASVGAGAMVILLASREVLHRALRSTDEPDIRALLRLVLVVLIILPLLPDAGMGPFQALNPRRLWLVVVVTSSIGLAGYGLARWLGERRGALATAVVGALISSTAVTLDSARRLHAGSSGPPNDAAVAIASLIMLARAILLTGILAPLALTGLATLLLPATLVAALFAAGLLYRAGRTPDGLAMPEAKPPGLGLALLFALTVAVLSIASAWAQARLGDNGGALVIALGGTADIDAAIAAVGSLPPGRLPLELATLALAAPILFNTVFKLAILLAVARTRRALPGAGALVATALALAGSIAAAVV